MHIHLRGGLDARKPHLQAPQTPAALSLFELQHKPVPCHLPPSSPEKMLTGLPCALPGSGIHWALPGKEGKAESLPGSHGQQPYFPPLAMPRLDTLASQSKCLCLPVPWLGWIYLALECSVFLIKNCPARPQEGWVPQASLPASSPTKLEAPAWPWGSPGPTDSALRQPITGSCYGAPRKGNEKERRN